MFRSFSYRLLWVLALTAIPCLSLAAAGPTNDEGEHASADDQSTDEQKWQDYSPGLLDKCKERGQNVFIVFVADWCPVCERYQRTTLDNDEIRERFEAKRFLTIKVDIEELEGTAAELMKSFEISAVPTTILIRGDGAEAPDVEVGLRQKEGLLELLDAFPGGMSGG